MNVDLASFLTPDGRWQLLQNWIDDDPKRSAIVDGWLRQTPEEIFPQLRDIAADIATKQYGPLAGSLARVAVLTPEMKHWIEELKTIYKERLQLDQEAKNAKQRRSKRAHRQIRGRDTG